MSSTKRSIGDAGGSSNDKAGTSRRSPMGGKQQPYHQQHNHSIRNNTSNSRSPTKKRRDEEGTRAMVATKNGTAGSGSKSPRRHSQHHGGLGAALEEMRERKWATIAGPSSSSGAKAQKLSTSSAKSVGEKAAHRQQHHHNDKQHKPAKKRETKGGAQRRLTFASNHKANDDDAEEDDDTAAGPSGAADAGTSSASAQMRVLPLSKVRTIMEASPNANDMKISGEAMFAMSKAAEAFISMLAKGAYQQMLTGSHSRINYNELAMFVHDTDELNFIQDILPQKHKFSEQFSDGQCQKRRSGGGTSGTPIEVIAEVSRQRNKPPGFTIMKNFAGDDFNLIGNEQSYGSKSLPTTFWGAPSSHSHFACKGTAGWTF
ncbi:hypothetical protein niasHT_024805 [Heterodera trifolii]|uniref:Nuclear transcription factor Y subunit gamma n=1 Tax=Heterodera trifolii TaxID=157864 RepID=A0ABD2KFF6_9BILA